MTQLESKLIMKLAQVEGEKIILKDKIDKAIKKLFNLKDMVYKPETREINFDIQREISTIIKILGDKE